MINLTDFHTHILPGIDDGSSSVEESVVMLQEEARQGVHTVVLTPHFYPNHDSPERFFSRRQAALEKLQMAIAGQSGYPRLLVGAEVYFYMGMSDSTVLRELAISGTDCILVEMPSPPWSERMIRELVQIREKQGLVPIIAHIDRYISPFHTYGIPAQLEQVPVLVQANGSFFTQRATRSMALKLLRTRRIHLLGSDCHGTSYRTPNLGEAVRIIERHLGPDAMEHLHAIAHEMVTGV